jgi:hypothetical protein
VIREVFPTETKNICNSSISVEFKLSIQNHMNGKLTFLNLNYLQLLYFSEIVQDITHEEYYRYMMFKKKSLRLYNIIHSIAKVTLLAEVIAVACVD